MKIKKELDKVSGGRRNYTTTEEQRITDIYITETDSGGDRSNINFIGINNPNIVFRTS